MTIEENDHLQWWSRASAHPKEDAIIEHEQWEVAHDLEYSPNADTEHKQMIATLQEAWSAKDQVEIYAKYMDKYGIDWILWMIPVLWDAWVATISSMFMLYQANKMWFGMFDKAKLLSYQAVDFVAWSIPFVWWLLDFFGVKSNNRSAELFEEAYEDALRQAEEKWVTKDIINKFAQEKKTFDEHLKMYI